MKLVVVLGILSALFPSAVFYCFHRRSASMRPGVFYVLVAALACEALLVSALAVEGAKIVRDSVTGDHSGIGDHLDQAEPDPSGAVLVAIQPSEISKPTGSDKEAWRD